MGNVQVKYKSKTAEHIAITSVTVASQAEHGGSIPLTCSTGKTPVTVEISRVTGVFLFNLPSGKYRSKPKKCGLKPGADKSEYRSTKCRGPPLLMTYTSVRKRERMNVMAIMIELSPERLECQEIEAVLRRLRIPGTRVGQRYLAYAVQCAMLDPDLTLTRTGALYPMIADNFGVTRTGVERAMRTAVQASWERGGRATLDEIAGYHLDVRPTTFEFVDIVAAYLIRSMQS